MRNNERVITYRGRATELRTEAETLTDQVSKRQVLEIAERYARLADRIEAKDGSRIAN
jgi:hypothetical protein